MKNFKKLIAMMLMLASVFFIACSEDSEDKLSKEVTKTEITQLSTDLSVKLDEMTESKGMVAMEALMSLEFPFVTEKSNTKSEVLNNIQKYLLPYNYVKKDKEKSSIKSEPFDFERWVGTYEWNNTVGAWDPDYGTPSDKIIIIFPADTNNLDNNNATLTIHNYNDKLIEDDHLPTNIEVDLYISDIRVIDINLTATWFESGEYIGEPTSLDVSVYLIPFEFTGDFNHTTTAANVDFAINYNTEQFFSIGVGATWANAGDSIPSNINGYVQFFNVKFQANADVENILVIITDFMGGTSENSNLDEVLDDVNKEIDAYVTVDGTWAADIELALVPYTNDEGLDDFKFDILFVYADGSSESAIPYFEELGEDMEEFFGNLEEYYNEW